MKDKITLAEFRREIYGAGEEDVRDENVNKVFNLDDDALNFSSLDYYYFSNHIKSSKSFEAVLKSDLKRIENFKEKFDFEKFNQRSKKYKKLVHYWHKEFDENFINLIERLMKYIKIPYSEIPQKFLSDGSKLTDSALIFIIYERFLASTFRTVYCFDKYFDRFNFNYDIDTKAIKVGIEKEIQIICSFSSNLVNILGFETLPIEMVDNLLKEFRSGRQLTDSKEKQRKLVAEYITIMEKHFKKLTGIQKKACELAGENQYSFSSWLNKSNKAGGKKNFDTYLKWRKEKIPAKKVKELKTNIANYLKST